MSTERKPGSRGTLNPFTRDRANPLPRGVQAPDDRNDDDAPRKGSTKTASPRKGFKKRKK